MLSIWWLASMMLIVSAISHGRILRSGKLPNCWVLPGMVQEPVFLAAAKEPILFTKEEPFFEPESFLTFVLENAGVDGHA